MGQMPAAKTVEQKCEMRSKPIGLKDFRDSENRFAREIRETAKSPAIRAIGRIMGMIIGIIFIIIGLGGFSATIFFPSVPAIIANHIHLGDNCRQDCMRHDFLVDDVRSDRPCCTGHALLGNRALLQFQDSVMETGTRDIHPLGCKYPGYNRMGAAQGRRISPDSDMNTIKKVQSS